MTHLTNGQLRAHLDGQTDATAHLAQCAECRARLTDIEARAARVGAHLNALAPLPREASRSTPTAYVQFIARRKEENSMLKKLFSRQFRPLWAGLTMVAVLAVALSFAPVRAWAGQFLGLFRVQQIAILPIDTTGLSALTNDQALGSRIGQLFADSATVTRAAEKPQTVASVEEASQLAGFAVRSPDVAPSQIMVQSGTAFEFVVNRDRAQAILNDAGRSDLQLPRSLEGAHIAVDIPAAVTLGYGSCPSPASEDEKGEGQHDRIPWAQLRKCVLFVQVPSPTVSTPPDVDMAQLAELGLQFTGMSAEEAHQLSQTVDWTSTLVVPLPQDAAEYIEVQVDGVSGYLLSSPSDEGRPASYTILWTRDGIIYALSGFDDAEVGLSMANGLK
jgi:hypothetical protein